MNSEQVNRGMRLRRYRQEKKLTLRELATATGLSIGFLSKIENGTGNPSIDNIQKICFALGITVNDLVTEKNSSELFSAIHENESYILRKDERCLLYNYGDNIRFESVFEGNPHFKVNIFTLSGRSKEHYSTIHSYDELGVVAKGSMSINLAGQGQYELTEGDCIMIRARTPHTVIPLSDEKCISFWVEISEGANDAKP